MTDENLAEENLTEEVQTTAAPVKRGNRWAETKSDLKWASVLLFVLILIGPNLIRAFTNYSIWTPWEVAPTGREDLGSIAAIILAADGLVVPFEVLGILLLAALLGAVAIALRDPYRGVENAAWRPRDVDAPPQAPPPQEREP